jgi:hypothetical protein
MRCVCENVHEKMLTYEDFARVVTRCVLEYQERFGSQAWREAVQILWGVVSGGRDAICVAAVYTHVASTLSPYM